MKYTCSILEVYFQFVFFGKGGLDCFFQIIKTGVPVN